MKDTVLQAVDYTNTENEKYNKRIRICNIIGMLLVVAYMLLIDSDIYTESHTVRIITSLIQGMAVGMMFTGLIFSSRYGTRIRAFKMRLLGKDKEK